MIEQGAVSTCVRALMCRVRAVARTLRRKSPHANSSRPGDATRAPGRQRMRGCSSGRSSARRRRPRRDCCRPAARVEVLDAHAERAARARVHVEHDAMTNNKAAERRSKLVGKIWLLHTCSALLRCKCVGASCSYRTAANRSSWRMNGFAMLMYDTMRQCWNSVGPGGNCAARWRARARAAASTSARRSRAQAARRTAAPSSGSAAADRTARASRSALTKPDPVA